ncbi:hypothetical protein EBT31_01370, partial [bacterium]|nr:hypothetical protein [bacterium]
NMKTAIDIVLKIVLSLIMIMPIFGALGFFPAPTADLYNTPEAFTFIQTLMSAGYINAIMAIIFILALVALWTKREALTALLILPLTVNIVAFHLFLDGGLFTAGAVMGNILALINIYFLWQQRAMYRPLLMPKK